MLNINNLSKSFADNTLFTALSLSVGARDRIAVLGANGSGKTTLFEIIYGNIQPDKGSITKSRDLTIGYLKQEIESLSDMKLLDDVLKSYESINDVRHRLEATLKKLGETDEPNKKQELLNKLGKLQHECESSDIYDAEHKAKIILGGLGFKEQDFTRSLNEFSGGWLMRVELAKLLMINPDILILDEPTNQRGL
jgi:ATP-binding cassette subfamily F protein 3